MTMPKPTGDMPMTPSESSRDRTGEVAPPEQPPFEVLRDFAGALVEQLLPGLLDGVARSTAEILETVRLEATPPGSQPTQTRWSRAAR